MSTADKEHLKCFAVKLGRLKDRIDVKFYLLGGHEILSLGSVPLGSLVLQEPDYGSGARAVPMSGAKDVTNTVISKATCMSFPLVGNPS